MFTLAAAGVGGYILLCLISREWKKLEPADLNKEKRFWYIFWKGR